MSNQGLFNYLNLHEGNEGARNLIANGSRAKKISSLCFDCVKLSWSVKNIFILFFKLISGHAFPLWRRLTGPI